MADPDPKFVEVLEMITHCTSSESKPTKERYHVFCLFFSSLESCLYTHDKFEVQPFRPLEVFSKKI